MVVTRQARFLDPAGKAIWHKRVDYRAFARPPAGAFVCANAKSRDASSSYYLDQENPVLAHLGHRGPSLGVLLARWQGAARCSFA